MCTRYNPFKQYFQKTLKDNHKCMLYKYFIHKIQKSLNYKTLCMLYKLLMQTFTACPLLLLFIPLNMPFLCPAKRHFSSQNIRGRQNFNLSNLEIQILEKRFEYVFCSHFPEISVSFQCSVVSSQCRCLQHLLMWTYTFF